ncbi:hypothetical protein LTR56_003452 [Elasticomyces elasticus]|nr:hypothetical protein LTR22_010928 [Elasticomyces elasticus]KAK3655446.1 hypothetical protein LTR56_003452 [Elasticomyces elasticus]KAK4919917.1 hypothetical protein LTR49_012515 [Elasticomyces elasticus]KAK5756701.1 hypothetical protein LTS12_013164 [Elasticomyces elasticus]
MAAMLPTGAGGGGGGASANPYAKRTSSLLPAADKINSYAHYDAPTLTEDDDLIDPDDATLDDLEDPSHNSSSSDRNPLLSGNISTPQSRTINQTTSSSQNYLTSAIPGEDRRAPVNTIDESVWDTLRRDLLAVWEKMRQVLYPKYLLGGMMGQGSGIGGAERAEGGSLSGGVAAVRGIVGRWPDADVVLQGGMSEGLRDWDLWGPLLFSLLLSFLLSLNAREDQRSLVFSGVFATIWIASAIVTLQIKLLGGNMYVNTNYYLTTSSFLKDNADICDAALSSNPSA